MSTKQTRAAAVVRDPRWAAVVARDSRRDGEFFFSVATTGVYCRPSCAARPARPENVAFHVTTEAAERAGFRPCKRCKPDQPSLDERRRRQVAELCRFIEQCEEMPTLETLAEHAGTSVHHVHRIFKAITGVTPKVYAEAHRDSKVREGLRRGGDVTGAIYEAGFNSSGRFYERSKQVLGMTPTQFRAGGTDVKIHFAIAECSLGTILVATSPVGVCAISLGDDPELLVRELQDQFANAELIGGDAEFESLIAHVIELVESPGTALELPLDVRGTAFQQRVWRVLKKIPAGQTATYTEIAKKIGAPKSVRAVASACAANTLAVVIPCHRVVRSDGALSGYRWGVERKRKLLDRESK